MRAKAVRPLRLTTPGTLAQRFDILESLPSHLPVPLLGVRHLLLGHRAQDGIPYIPKQGG